MPDEPKQNMEEQLRAFARQRRDAAGASFNLPATARERLQSEVERTYAKSRAAIDEPGLIGWLAGFGLRFAVGGAAFAVLVLAAIFWLPGLIAPRIELAKRSATVDELRIERLGANGERKQDAQLRGLAEIDGPPLAGAGGERAAEFFKKSETDRDKRDSSLVPAASSQALALAPQTAQEPLTRPASESVSPGKADSYNFGARGPQAPTPVQSTAAEGSAPLSPSPPVPQLADSRLSQARAPGAVGAGASSDAPVTKDAQQDSSAALGARPQAKFAFENEAVTLRGADQGLKREQAGWSFQQTDTRLNYRRNFNSPPAPQILNSFQVQQTGANLRVTDADGSVYEGTFDSAALRAEPSLAERSRAAGRGGRGGGARPTLNEAQASQSSTVSSLAVGRPFRVVGTNRTLNQLVVLNGQFQAATNFQEAPVARGINADTTTNSGLELQGTAKVGQSTEIPVRAFGRGP